MSPTSSPTASPDATARSPCCSRARTARSSRSRAAASVVARDLRIEDATFSGIHVQGPHPISGLVLDDIVVEGPGTMGILINGNAQGDAQADAVVVTGGPGLQNDAPGAWKFSKGAGNRGW